MRDREISCVSYLYEGKCAKGHKGLFRKTCQTCPDYVAVRGGRPARKNLKREKLEKIRNSEIY